MGRDPVELIMSDPDLSDGERVLLFWLWWRGGGRPNRYLTNKLELAGLAHRDIRTVEGNLKRLRAKGRIDCD